MNDLVEELRERAEGFSNHIFAAKLHTRSAIEIEHLREENARLGASNRNLIDEMERLRDRLNTAFNLFSSSPQWDWERERLLNILRLHPDGYGAEQDTFKARADHLRKDRDRLAGIEERYAVVADSLGSAVLALEKTRAESAHRLSAIDYTKAILETQEWWHDPGHDLYPLRFVLEDAAADDLPPSVSDENPKGENAERSRGEALPARCHEMTDALTPSLSPKEQKGE